MTSQTTTILRPLVLFDGGCPLCRKEIEHYRKLSGAEGIDWRDVHKADAVLTENALTLDATMQRMHVRDSDGIWHTGAAAFAVMWSSLPAYRWLGWWAKRPVISHLGEWLYGYFAVRRYKARCRDGYCPL